MLICFLCLTFSQIGLQNKQQFNNNKIHQLEEDKSGNCGSKLAFLLKVDTGILTISGSGAMNNYEFSPYVPWNEYRMLIQEVVIEDNVTSISKNAFYDCRNIHTVRISENVSSIGSSAFYNCTELASISIPEKVTAIYEETFQNCCKLASINIPTGVNFIGSCAFSSCKSLTTVGIPNGVTSFSSNIFSDCYRLRTLTYGARIRSIADSAFSNCVELQSFTIGDDVTSIGSFSFYNCSGLTSITIPDKITTLNNCVFQYCTGLTSVTIGKAVSTISNSAFIGCSKLVSFSVSDENGYFASPDGILYSKDLKTLRAVPNKKSNNIVFSENITRIEGYSFYSCYELISITIPGTVTAIGSYAFYNCTGLQSIILKENLKTIDSSAFQYCSALISIKIPDTVTYIGINAFSYCGALETINLSTRVTEYSNNLFLGCSSLQSFTISEKVTKIGNNVFQYCSSLLSIEIPEKVTTIGSGAFHSCTGLTSIVIPEKVTKINANTFRYCSGIGSFVVHDMITVIDNYAFSNCTKLRSIKLGAKVQKIGISAFSECVGLIGILTIPATCTSIGKSAFVHTSFSKIIFNGLKEPSSCKNAFIEAGETVPESLKAIVLDDYTGTSFCGLDITHEVIEPEISSEIDIITSSNDEIDQTSLLIDQVPSSPEEPVASSNIEQTSSQNEHFISSEKEPIYQSSYEVIISSENKQDISELQSKDISDFYTIPQSPIITPDISPITTNEYFVTLDIDENADEKKLNQKLNEAFESMNKYKNSYHIAIINLNHISFNSNLEEHQFIKPIHDSIIDFIGGNLNIILQSQVSITISLNNDEETKISVKGNGELNINHLQDSKPALNIVNKFLINGSTLINVPNTVESLTIDSLDLSSKSSIAVRKGNNEEEKVQLTVKNIVVNNETDASISDLIIQNSMIIFQSAKVNVNNIKLDEANIEYRIFEYDTENSPFFSGTFNNPPKSLVINKIKVDENDHTVIDAEYNLISGQFEESKCEEWLDKIEFGNSDFTFKTCLDNKLFSMENKRIVLKTTSKSGAESDKENKSLKKLEIVAIVIGSVAGVALITFAVVMIVRKMKGSVSEKEISIYNANEEL